MYWWDQNVNDAVPSYHVRYSCSRIGNICDTLGCGRFDRNLYTPPIFDVTEWGRRMGTYDPRDTLAYDFVRNTEVVDRTTHSGCHRQETKLTVRPCGETRWPHASPPRIITGRSSKNWPPLWSWLAATARTPAPFMDPADRRWVLQHSCWMV